MDSAGYPAESIRRFLPDQTTPRAIGLLVDPNVLGVTLAGALPFGLAWTFGAARPRISGALAIAIVLAALALSLSRGAWLAAALAFLVWLAWTRPRAALALGALAAALIAAPIPFGPLEHVRGGLLAQDPSGALRVDELREAGRVIQRYPWLGVGYGAPPHPDIFAGVSNAWLWIAERAGIAAGLAALGLVLGALATAVRRGRRDRLARTAAASLSAVLLAGLVDHHVASFPHLVVLVGMLTALALVGGGRRSAEV